MVEGVEKYTHEGLLWLTFTWTASLEGNTISMQTQAADLEFSPKGDSIAYQAKTADGKYAVFVNGKPGPSYQGIGGRSFFVADQAKYYAFPADKEIVEVHGNQVLGPYDSSYATKVSPDGNHYALYAKKGDKDMLVVDDKEQDAPGKLADYVIGDKGVVAYAYSTDGKYRVRLGKTDLPGSYENVRDLTLSPDGGKVAYWALRDGKWMVIAGDKELPGFDGYFYYVLNGTQYSIMWSRDSQHVAYYVRSRGELALDGQKLNAEETPNGSGAAFVQALLAPDKKACSTVQAIMLGETLICTGKGEGGEYLHVGGKTEGPFKTITHTMTSPHHYAYVAETADGKQLVLDGVVSPHPYTAIYRLTFDEANGTLDYLAVKEDKVLHVVQPLPVKWMVGCLAIPVSPDPGAMLASSIFEFFSCACPVPRDTVSFSPHFPALLGL
ncbi:MAG: hypothetical protein ABSD31_10400 [Candidatus Binataceae bacterium]